MADFRSAVVIGLEIHVELKTASKLFCSCVRQGEEDEEPNTRCCPVCLGHPGSKPVLNSRAVEYALKLALATKSEIADQLIFSRKSYFYPDMSKNYQISQYELPLAQGGKIKLGSGKSINLERIHLEEDPAALVHPKGMQHSSYVLVDYNRSGNPLVEIVTKPEMSSPAEARDFMKQLITILEYLEIFDINNCIIKADANVSVRESGYVRSEIKNITGFKDIERALKYEVQRQQNDIAEGKALKQETRAWDSEKGATFSVRAKEVEEEYGYIIDPDLVPIDITRKWIDLLQKELPELAEQKLEKFQKKHKIAEDTARVLAKNKELANVFEAVASSVNPELAAKWIRRELPRVLNYKKKRFSEVEFSEKHLVDLLKLIEGRQITDKTGQKILEKLVEKPFDVVGYVKEQRLTAVTDQDELEKICMESLKESEKAVQDYKSGNPKALNYIVGIVMKKTRGKASPDVVQDILRNLISKS